MPLIDGSLHNDENTIYLTTADAPEVSSEIAAGRRRSASISRARRMDLRGAPNENICHADSQGRERAELTIQFPGGDLDTGDGYLLGCFSDRCHPFATRLQLSRPSNAPLHGQHGHGKTDPGGALQPPRVDGTESQPSGRPARALDGFTALAVLNLDDGEAEEAIPPHRKRCGH